MTEDLSGLARLRQEYARATLDETDIATDPITQFRTWFDEARNAGILEPNAMTLATSSPQGAPNARIVLLKELDARGFVFFTDYRSQKAADLESTRRAALVFLWKELERQVRVTGRVERTSAGESDSYFRTRPQGSRLGTWASHQSSVIGDRAELEAAYTNAMQRYPDDEIPRPEHWGGYRVVPETVEFWQGRASRLHDRLRYRLEGGEWVVERLSP